MSPETPVIEDTPTTSTYLFRYRNSFPNDPKPEVPTSNLISEPPVTLIVVLVRVFGLYKYVPP